MQGSFPFLLLHLLAKFALHNTQIHGLVQLNIKVLSDRVDGQPIWCQLCEQPKVFLHLACKDEIPVLLIEPAHQNKATSLRNKPPKKNVNQKRKPTHLHTLLVCIKCVLTLAQRRPIAGNHSVAGHLHDECRLLFCYKHIAQDTGHLPKVGHHGQALLLLWVSGHGCLELLGLLCSNLRRTIKMTGFIYL